MKKKIEKNNNAKNVILTISIAIICVFFVAYAIQAIYPSPIYSDYCDEKISTPFTNNSVECEGNNGIWTDYGKGEGYCDYYSVCSKEYNDVKDVYERNVFIINLILGIIIILLSFLLTVDSVSTGFMGGGTILLIYGTIRHWSDLSNVLKTIMLGFVLGVLIWLGYKKLK